MRNTYVQAVTDADFSSVISAADGRPCLIDTWAHWCTHCNSLAPILDELASANAKTLAVAALDTEAYPELARSLKVRSLPTLILFKGGVEVARTTGAKTFSGLHEWLSQQDIHLQPLPLNKRPPPSWGAFYGDEQLREFLISRMRVAASAGAIGIAAVPYWRDGKGTPSASLVQHGNPDVFERVTGMPVSFACVMEFVGIVTPEDIDAVFKNIPAGANLQTAALRMVHYWLSSSELPWAAALDDAELDHLRDSWSTICSNYLAGSEIQAEKWASLKTAAEAMMTTLRDPYRQIHNDLAILIATLSPPPHDTDRTSWTRILLQHAHYSRARIIEFQAGWSVDERAMQLLRDLWFEKHVPITPEGTPDQKILRLRADQWNRENVRFLEREAELRQQLRSLMRSFHNTLRAELVLILSKLTSATLSE
ncbi:MAG: thioredoxin domain-containing protein [Paraburkholderia tropica]|uniref:thioredoxin family protein n=1 Tax=Burkholderia gladioli TaxID=28095 RepID=UPI0016404475|nr:thioredoxin domain-containing protein [Burkholderia gladioli]MDN7499957.1 thioredoxin domain-containing protein [Burkholderia gladioli]